jgi:uncharacterized protein YqeY
MILDTINKQIVEAMKAKDEIRLSTLKLLLSALHNAKIDKRGDLTEEEELEIVRSEAKKRKDAIEAYKKAGATDRAEKEEKERVILQEFLPKELPDEEVSKLVDEAITTTSASSMQDMGKVIGAVMAKAKGRADGKKVAEMARRKLTE